LGTELGVPVPPGKTTSSPEFMQALIEKVLGPAVSADEVMEIMKVSIAQDTEEQVPDILDIDGVQDVLGPKLNAEAKMYQQEKLKVHEEKLIQAAEIHKHIAKIKAAAAVSAGDPDSCEKGKPKAKAKGKAKGKAKASVSKLAHEGPYWHAKSADIVWSKEEVEELLPPDYKVSRDPHGGRWQVHLPMSGWSKSVSWAKLPSESKAVKLILRAAWKYQAALLGNPDVKAICPFEDIFKDSDEDG
jgi:hypothetical protein